MSIGGGGGDSGGHGPMLTFLMQERDRVNAEAERVRQQNLAKEAEAEAKRVSRTKSGGAAAFTTNGYVGYTGRTLGAGASLTETV